MRTTKKLLSILLALCMVVSLLPATALAAEGTDSGDTVATVDGTPYTDLQTAINEADGKTVVLQKDVQLTAKEDDSNAKPLVVTGKVTLDMNEKTISNTEDIWAGNNWSIISVREGGDLTITGNGVLKAKENDCYAVDLVGGKCTIENGTFVGNISVVYVNVGHLTVNGGDFSIQQKETKGHPERFTLNCLDGNYKNGTATISVTGGTFKNFNPENNLAEGADTNFCAGDYVGVVEKEEGTDTYYAVKPLSEVAEAKIVIDDKPVYYRTLTEAISNAKAGETVTLLKDTTISQYITVKKTMTLDLGGKTLTKTGDAQAVTAISGATLTIKNGTIIAPKTVLFVYRATMVLEDGAVIKGGGNAVQIGYTDESNPGYYWGKAVVNDGAYISGEAGVLLAGPYPNSSLKPDGTLSDDQSSRAELVVNGGTITGTAYAVSGNGTYQGTTIEITGGTIRQAGNGGGGAIYHPQNGTLSISGNPVIEGESGIQLCSGEGIIADISGGTIHATDIDRRAIKKGDGFIPDGAALSVVNRNYPGGTPKMTVSGGYFASDHSDAVMAYTWSNNQASDWAEAKEYLTITGGHFTSDPSAYVAEGYAALPGTETGYAFTVGTKPNVDVEPTVGDPVVDMSAIPEASKKDAETVAKSVEDKGELAAAANSVLNTVTEEDKAAAEQALQEALSPTEGTNITTYVQTYLDIKPTAYDETSKTFTLDITPMYRVVASTKDKAEEIVVKGEEGTGETANAVVLKGSETELTALKTMTISVTLPDSWSAAYVQHKGYEYVATVDGKVATFTNPHGFSEFVFSATPAAAAEVNGERYMNLNDALNAAKDNDTVTILKAPDANTNYSMSGDSRTITLKREESGNDFNVTINGTKYTVTTSGVKVTYTAPTYTGPSGYAVKTEVGAHGKLTVSSSYATKGTTVTVTVTPDKGYVLSDLTVTDKNGNALTLTDKGNGKYTFVMPEGAVTVKAAFGPESLPFTDVSQDAYYANAVKWAVDNGVTSGLTDTTFGPNVSCTRAQVVTFLWRAAGSPVVNYAMKFTDVPADAYYAEAVRWAVSKGITAGVTETTFGPEQTVTRAQVVAFLYRQAGSPAVGSKNPFTDVASDAYYADAVKWAVAQKITAGTTGTTFSPNADCTRGQIVTFLYNDMAK